MEFLGDQLSIAHTNVTGWVVNVRHSLQGTLSAMSSRGEGGFKRTNSMRLLASRSRESFRRFSLRSQQRLSLLRRTASPDTPAAVRRTLHMTHDTRHILLPDTQHSHYMLISELTLSAQRPRHFSSSNPTVSR